MIGKYLIKGIGCTWSALGFYRGFQSYCDDHANPIWFKAIGYGICGLFIYINPVSLPLIVQAEYKRATSNP